MNINEINPYVRFAEKRKNFKSYDTFVKAYDHRLFYVYNGKIIAAVESKEYVVEQNQMIIIPPNVSYKLLFTDDTYFSVLNFDLKYGSKITYGIQPDSEISFNEKNITSYDSCEEFPCILFCDEKSSGFMDEIHNKFVLKSTFGDTFVSAMLKLFIANAFIYTSSENIPVIVNDIIKYIDKNYPYEISNISLGNMFSYHPNYINRIFKQYTGYSLHNYITNVRLEKSMFLVKETNVGICEIAQRCGFCTQAYFTKKFREKYGITPYKFKNKKHL